MNNLNSKIIGLTALLLIFSLWSCNDDVQSTTMSAIPEDVPAAIHADFTRSYPDATDVAWALSGDYAVASFTTSVSRAASGHHSTVWYHLGDNQKKMHSTTIPFAELPSAVAEAFYAGEYATLTPADHADILTRYVENNVECIYKIYAKGALEGTVATAVKLYYTEDGVLVKASSEIVYDESFADNDSLDDLKEWLPRTPADFVSDYVNTYYPGARYLYIYEGHSFTKVKILDGHTAHLLLFDADGAWMSTATEIHTDDIPAEILDAFRASAYADWHIEKAVEHLTAADGHYYILSLKKGKNKAELRIDADGNVTDTTDTPADPEHPGTTPDGTNFLAQSDIEAYILARYPGASVLKYDFDDDEAEVEIVYKSHKIRIEFELHAQGYLWNSSEWDFDVRDTASIPAAILATISGTYGSYKLEYLSYLETATDAPCYEAGLKSSATKKMLKVKMDPQGNVIAEYGNR